MQKKMKCRKIENNLINYIEGTLPVDIMQDIASHLNECESCKLLFENVKTTYTSFEHLPEPVTDTFFFARIKPKLHHSHTLDNLVFLHGKFPRIAASVMFLIAIGAGIYIGSDMQNSLSSNGTITQTEMLEAYTNDYYLDDSGMQGLESLITNE